MSFLHFSGIQPLIFLYPLFSLRIHWRYNNSFSCILFYSFHVIRDMLFSILYLLSHISPLLGYTNLLPYISSCFLWCFGIRQLVFYGASGYANLLSCISSCFLWCFGIRQLAFLYLFLFPTTLSGYANLLPCISFGFSKFVRDISLYPFSSL